MPRDMHQIQFHPVAFVGAGPGDPDLLTVKALRALQTADVVIHDRLVSAEILALAGPQTRLRNAGKEGFGPSLTQGAINDMIVDEALSGARVVRLKSGDPAVFGRLDEELDAITEAGLDYTIVPGLTSASAAVAALGQSLTRRGRNTAVRLITGHDMQGYADQDWRALARDGEVVAIYMAKKAARFIQGRLLMHGAAPGTPVTIVENASRPDQRIVAATLATLPAVLAEADMTGPALLMYGLAPRDAARAALPQIQEMI
ncbi:uroporphyrinogen-III C-methyltransferase [Marivita sp.]|uniref:uroporphyrinogen-III C-methyltransferase n=1 Tax=Marivita sp. TaxID=2003365 RepID=UPI0025C71491|nr:uroporphyrinogen-III C-methyltransferase [Marivita sp.]